MFHIQKMTIDLAPTQDMQTSSHMFCKEHWQTIDFHVKEVILFHLVNILHEKR